MVDRERMFRKPMTVSAEMVRVIADAASARVIFVQRWASGGYSDVGSKELVLRRGPGAKRRLQPHGGGEQHRDRDRFPAFPPPQGRRHPRIVARVGLRAPVGEARSG
jgi:hypothetical protein